MLRPRARVRLVGALIAVACAACGVDDPTLQPRDDPRFSAPPPDLPDRGHVATRQVFFGDLHIHTSLSYDAYTFGVRALPDDAYVYAKGGTISHGVGYPIRASRPLDFAAVTDHAEYLGAARWLDEQEGPDRGPTLRQVLDTGSRLRITWNFIEKALFQMASGDIRDASFRQTGEEVATRAWREIQDAAARHDEPGRFTTFVAYEWSAMPDEENLHRNVVYRGSRVPGLPVSSIDAPDPEDLWNALDAQRAAGMPVLAIPHNANVSNGRMYARLGPGGEPWSAAQAETRTRNEPVHEILQVKGQSETHPALSPSDEFADFELFDRMLDARASPSEPRGSYARDALRAGLESKAQRGSNPFRFGFLGSSDSHNASSSVEEDDYHGKLPLLDGTAGLRLGASLLLPKSQNRAVRWSAAGLAAVWAEENTRGALFDAMRRMETYATSGPRITVRFFGGLAFAEGLVDHPGFVERAYAAGVPMGGTLVASPGSGAPRFAVVAQRDPIGANLDRIQIVKGWVDDAGRSHERVFDVAASDGRVPDASGRVAPLPSTVDLATATYENRVGAPRLATVWRDPEFDPDHEAFYYARVLEIATPRWSTHDAVALGVPAPEPATLQERAITSAIWLRPAD